MPNPFMPRLEGEREERLRVRIVATLRGLTPGERCRAYRSGETRPKWAARWGVDVSEVVAWEDGRRAETQPGDYRLPRTWRDCTTAGLLAVLRRRADVKLRDVRDLLGVSLGRASDALRARGPADTIELLTDYAIGLHDRLEADGKLPDNLETLTDEDPEE